MTTTQIPTLRAPARSTPGGSTPAPAEAPAPPAPSPSAFQLMMVAARDRRLVMAARPLAEIEAA